MGAHTSAGRREAAGSADRSDADIRRVLDAIRLIVQALREASRESERQAGLTAAQLFVLRRLAEADGMSLNDLALGTFTHQSSVSTVVARLVRRRLVARRVAASDRRRLSLSLTAAGRRALQKAPGAAQERLIAAVAALPPRSIRLVGDALLRVARATSGPGRRTRMFFDERAPR